MKANAKLISTTLLSIMLVLGTTIFAGGFWINLKKPGAAGEPAVKNAAALVEVGGCHNPRDAQIIATAEGLVGGQRRSVPLKVVSTSFPAIFAVQKSALPQGVWVVSVSSRISSFLFSADRAALAELGSDGSMIVEKAQTESGVVTEKRIQAALTYAKTRSSQIATR